MLTESQIFESLYHKFPKESFALLCQVADRTGSANRYADALAFGLWPSRGLYLHGVEIKSRRSDFVQEVRNPEKADKIAKHCNFWWIATTPEVAQKEEVPDTWGLLHVVVSEQGNTVRVAKQAKFIESAEPLTLPFVCSIMRAFSQQLGIDKLKAELRDEVREEVAKAERESCSRELNMVKKDRDSLQALIADFEKKCGVRLTAWNVGDIVSAYELERSGGVRGMLSRMKSVACDLKDMSDRINKLVDEDA